MKASDEQWINVLDDFRVGLSEPGECQANNSVRFANFLEERFPEIKFPWLRENMVASKLTKFDAFLEEKGVCVGEDSSAPAEGEDSSDSSGDDGWEEICNHGDWSKPLLDYRNIADIEILPYGGGPSGGYVIQDGQLYKWHQDWGTPKEMTKQSGYLIVREAEYSSSHSRYYECLYCDEDAKLETVLKQYGLDIELVSVNWLWYGNLIELLLKK
jgi:hypothetical protein